MKKTNLGDEFRAVAVTMKLLAATSQDERGMQLLEKLRLKIYQDMISTLHEDPFLRIVPIPKIRCHVSAGVEGGIAVISHPCMGDTALIAVNPEDTLVPSRWQEVKFAQLGERALPFMSPCVCCQHPDEMDSVFKLIIRNGFKGFTMRGVRGVNNGHRLGKDDPYRHYNLRFIQFTECEWIMRPSFMS